jgi:hypothetical protein
MPANSKETDWRLPLENRYIVTTAGVEELADAQDLGFCPSRSGKPTHRYSTSNTVYRRQFPARSHVCALLLTVAHRSVTDKLKAFVDRRRY